MSFQKEESMQKMHGVHWKKSLTIEKQLKLK